MMGLEVTERQTMQQWYELSGDLKARELFPQLLPTSESVKDAREVDEEIRTEPEEKAGPYDGFSQPLDAMQDEVDEFTKAAIAEFHDEALTAAKALLTALKAGSTLLHKDFEEVEEEILEEAAKELGVAIPWDPVEAAQIAAAEAARRADRLARAKALLADKATAIEGLAKHNLTDAQKEILRAGLGNTQYRELVVRANCSAEAVRSFATFLQAERNVSYLGLSEQEEAEVKQAA
jgi:hypothetical protein